MKKISEILKYVSCFALSLMLMTSCDKEADKLKIETETLNYSGTFYMLLCTAEFNSAEDNINIDIDTVPGNIKIDISNEGYAVVDFVPGREINLTIPFFYREEDADGDYVEDAEGNYIYTAIPMDIYEKSPILKLYNAVNEDVNVLDDEKVELRNLLCEIKNTITIAPFKTSRIPLIQQGASIVSYDFEQNTFYSSYTLGDVAYSYKSNLVETIKYVKQNLLSKMAADKKATAEAAIQTIENIASSITGKMGNAWGRLTVQYMNYYCDYDMRIQSEEERPNEMLVNISKLLYGEENGKPIKDLWFNIGYVGHMGDSSGAWEEKREE
jgi:hypothetical protein